MNENTQKTRLTVPQLGEGIVEVRILRLLKSPGDTVAKDEPLYEMEHDKAALKIESPVAGRLDAWLVEEGHTVPIGGAVADVQPAPERAGSERDAAASDEPARGASTRGAWPREERGATPVGTVRIPPRTRAHARSLGLDESTLTSIPALGGSLMPADLERFVAAQRQRAVAAPAAAAPAGKGSFTDVPVSARQRDLNRAMRAGTGHVVPAVVTTEIAGEALDRVRDAVNRQSRGSGFATAFQVFARVTARVAADFPRLRSRRLGEDRLRVFDRVHIGIACAADDGDLTIGVVRDADDLDAAEFDRRYADAVERALGGESQADGDVTLMLSHLEGEGTTFAVPVVVQPAVATLFLGAPESTAVRRVVLAFDHTVLNGHEAARFLAALRTALVELEPRSVEQGLVAPRPAGSGRDRAAAVRTGTATALQRLDEIACSVLGHAVDVDRPLGEQGFDSARALRLVREVSEEFGVPLPATAIWRHPTLRLLAGLLPGAQVAESVAATAGPAKDKAEADAVAVIGMSCRFPGADDAEAFWSLLAEGGCRIGVAPPGRLAGAVPEEFRAALLDRIDLFDARFFDITPRQAGSLDPQQRALLELSWHALENAALNPDDLVGAPVGVFAAVCSYDYREQLIARDAADGYATVGTFPAFLANRISHTYDFTGPSLTVDTACSGALTALALAESAIRAGDCELALVGAANLLSNGFNAHAFQRAGMLSPQGDSRVFDEAADGFVRGEGAGWVVLKPLRRAVEDGDPVLAVLRGTAVNHGGRAAALTAPNPVAQTALVRRALDRAGLRAADLGYLEAHGTGTPLGDPIELDAVREVLTTDPQGMPAQAAGPGGRLWVGSAKANIGHLEGASGLAGLVKAVQVLRHGVIPGTPNFTTLNPHIDLDGTPLAVADRAVAWPRTPGSPARRAAVSAFGFGGSNAHAVLEEAPALPGPASGTDSALVVVPLSAATPKALTQLAAGLADLLERADTDLRQAAWTLQSGRRALAHRALVVASDRAGVVAGARSIAAGRAETSVATAGHLAALDRLPRPADRESLTGWLRGGSVDWAMLWTTQVPRRLPLMPYPFQRESFWLPGEPLPSRVGRASEEPPADGHLGLRLLPVPAEAAVPAGPPAPQAPGNRVRVLSPEWVEESALPGPADERCPAIVLCDGHTAPLAVKLNRDGIKLCQVGPEGVDRRWLEDAVADAAAQAPSGPLSLAMLVGGARWTEDKHGLAALRQWLGALLRTVQVLQAAAVPAELRLVTTGLAAPAGGSPAAGAALQGALLGALRTVPREAPKITVAAVDLPRDTLVDGDAEPLRAAFSQPCGRSAPLVAPRGQRRHRQVLTERAMPAQARGFRPDGVYVLFGGTGGIGAEVARHLAGAYQASVLLVGRSAEDERIRSLLGELRAAGGRARYVTGDVTDKNDVAAALAECRRAFGEPEGLIHSIGSVSDALLTELTEADIDRVLETKVAAVLNLRNALRGRSDAALVLFSSVAGLFGSAGGLNYAAANAFLDHYAHAVDGHDGLVARTFDWGLWRGTGLARRYGAQVKRRYPGLTDFAPEEGVAALEAGMSGTAPQVVVVSGDPQPLQPLTRSVGCGDPAHRLEHYATGALARRMAELGLDSATAAAGTSAAVAALGVVPEHRRLLAAILDLVAQRAGRPVPDATELAGTRAGLLAAHPDLAGHVELLDRALAAYGPVLRGELSATEVLFPGGSMDAVTTIYSGNQLFDPANAAAAEALAAEAVRIATQTGRRPRILEVGAGVGGTTAAALDALDRHGCTDLEYAYTDVSHSFLRHARRRFGDRVLPKLLDIEKSPAAQGFERHEYDLLVASNVLHATRDLTRTLGHVAELLVPGGRLMLVEMVAPAAVYTLTFGLTDGWWRYVDDERRLPHGPLLDVDRWRAVLTARGWELAGTVQLRDVPGCVALLDCVAPAGDAPPAGRPVGSAASADRLREIVRELLGDPHAEVAAHLPWPELGIDSLLNVELVNAVSAVFGEIPATALFEHRTLEELSRMLDGRAAATGPGPGGDAELLAELTALVAGLTGQEVDLLDPDEDFPAIGVDSLLISECVGLLRRRFPDRRIPSTVLFERPTLRELTRWLIDDSTLASVPAAGRVRPETASLPIPARTGTEEATAARPPARPAEVSPLRSAIAVVGLAGRYPGAADVDAFWQLLSAGRTPVTEVPADRWDWRTARTLGGGYARWGCFVDDWDRFDPALFGITPRDAAVMDPQERLFLQVAWEAFEAAGYSRRSLSWSGDTGGPRVGVFAGVTANSHLIAQRDARLAGAENPEYAVTAAASVANRVSYALDLRGPSLTVDTMCSSSLTALHLACRALQNDDAELALAGGVNLYLHPDRFAGLCALGMPSRGDRTRAFGAHGDGFVPGEGVGAVVLKRLADVEADGDTVYAVIRGTGLNHGGGTGGYTVPNPLAQAALIGSTLRAAGVRPGDVEYVEAHGTGTELGDPIELRALALAFGDGGTERGPLRIGSVKSNIGHGEAAAGIAGLTKAILQLRHGQLAPTLHAEEPNPKLDLDGTPLSIQRRAEHWPRRSNSRGEAFPRRAAVSSFGAGGSNAHVVLEEYRPVGSSETPRRARPAGPVVVPLSAPDAERLGVMARRLAETLTSPGAEALVAGSVDLADVAYTLSVGREIWTHRAAVVAGEVSHLREALTALAEGREHPALITAGNAEQADPAAREWVAEGRPPAVAAGGRRVALPTTPFARTRCVLPGADEEDDHSRPAGLPLADTLYVPATRTVTARLGHASRWVADHVVDGEPLLPGAFHPELVYEALLTAGGSPYRSTLRDLVWPAPAAGLPLTVCAELAAPEAHGGRRFTVEAASSGGVATVARGWTEPSTPGLVQPVLRYRPSDLDRRLADGGVGAEEFYRPFGEHGFTYGPLYRTVRRAWCADTEIVAELRLPDGEDRDGRHVLHPALLDGACQAAAFLLLSARPRASRRYRPLAVERLAVYAPATGAAYVHARRTGGENTPGVHVFDLRLIATDSGEPLAEVEGFRVRVDDPDGAARDVPAEPERARLKRGGTAPRNTAAEPEPVIAGYRLDWSEAPRPAKRAAGPLWTVGSGFAARSCGPTAAAAFSLVQAAEGAGLDEAARRTGTPGTLLVDLTEDAEGFGFGVDPLTPEQVGEGWSRFRAGALARVFGLLRALVRSRALDGTRVLLLTRTAGTPAPAARGLHSLVRTVAAETGRLSLTLATVDSAWLRSDPRGAAREARAEAQSDVTESDVTDGADWVLLGPGGLRRRAILVPAAKPALPAGRAGLAELVEPRGSYLVVGGLGALGRTIAEAVRAARPTAELVLVGRSAPDPAALEALRNQAPGGSVVYHRCDVTDRRQLAAFAAALERSATTLRGVVYAAGVLRDGFLRSKTLEAVEEVCRAKILGAVAVDAAFAEHPLDFFAVASSLASLVGNQGQSDYAFANGFLDGFAAARARWVERGLRRGRTLSVGWPVLDGAGMRPEPAALGYLADGYGLRPVAVRTAVRALWPWLAAATGPESAHVALVAGDQELWCRALRVVQDHPHEPGGPLRAAPDAVAPTAVAWAGADHRAATLGWLADRMSRAIGVPVAALDSERALVEYGVDSIALMRLHRLLEDELGRVPLALLLDSGTLGELTDRLLREHNALISAAVRASGPEAGTEAHTEAGSGVDEEGALNAPALLPDRLIGLWAADAAAAPHAPYNISLSWELPTEIDRAALDGAVVDLVRRHAVLACCVRPHLGEPAFVPAGAGPALETRRLAADKDLEPALREEADRRFALSSEPLLRAVLWETGRCAVLQLTTHHVAVDGRSAELIQQDLAALYAARTGAGGALAPATPFAAALRRERDETARTRARDESFWTEQLDGLSAERLFGDGGGQRGAAGAHREYQLPSELSQMVSHLAREAGVTSFTVLLAAFSAALSRATGSRSFMVAVPTYGRASRAEESTVGCFTNSVPLRIELDPARPVASWLDALQDQVRGAVAHAGMPYPRLAELCRTSGGQTSVPTVTFAYQNWLREDGAESRPAAGPLGHLVRRRGQRGHFELGLEVTDTPAGIEVLANHRTAVLEGAEVDGLVEDMRRVIVELARALTGGVLGTLVDPGAGTLVSRFADTVRASPDKPAVEDRHTTVSYRELDELSDSVSQRVSSVVAPGEPVAVLMHRSARLAAVLLGILKSGRPYVPLDESYPAERLRLVVEGAGCSVAVVDSDLAPLLPSGVGTLTAEDLVTGGAPDPAGAAPAAPGPAHLAYLMFTSGSTGRPKGVAVTHGNVVHTLEAIAATVEAGAADRLLAVTTVCFDISVLELFLPLITGGTVVVADHAEVIDPGRLTRLIDGAGITVMQATPAGWQLLIDGGWPGASGLTALCGGEALPPNLARELLARTATLWNVYGPTEATIWSTIARVDGTDPVHLGGPLGATDLVVTETGGTVPPADGEPGELWIGGPSVAQGYWRQPDLTAQRFTAHPSLPDGGGRYFRTGDLVRRDEAGRLIFLGRTDNQVKIRGHRVELGEIESVLEGHPGLSRVVLTVRGAGAAARLVAIAVATRGDAGPDLDELRGFGSDRLPAWMLPERLVTVSALPMTPNGKVDRNAAARLAVESEGSRETVARVPAAKSPLADAEPRVLRREVAAAWAELLELSDIPHDRSFFDLGGNSLLVGRLFARLDTRYPGTGLEVADLFARPTLDDQVELLACRIVSGDSASGDSAPGDSASGDSAPGDSASGDSVRSAPEPEPAPAPVRPSRRDLRRALRLGDDHR